MSDEALVHVAATAGSGGVSIDLAYWARQQARLEEVATVTPPKAPELMSAFNRCVLGLDELCNKLEYEYQMAQREVDGAKARFTLDRLPTILAEKGWATARSPLGSEDTRSALLAVDAEYLTAVDAADRVNAVLKLMRGKRAAFERAWKQVRTTNEQQSYNPAYRRPDPRLSHDPSTANHDAPQNTAPSGYGRASYSFKPRTQTQPVTVEATPLDDVPY